MRNWWIRSTALCGSLLLGVGVCGAQPNAPTPRSGEAVNASSAVTPTEREGQLLMAELDKASEAVLQKAESADSWRYQTRQAEILLRLAVRSSGDERDKWLRMAVVSYASAAGQCPATEPAGYQTLTLLPDYITKNFPSSKLYAFAVEKEIEADYNRVLAQDGMTAARQRQSERLLAFAAGHPNLPEAPLAILKAAQIGELMGKTDDACRVYRKLAETYPNQEVARKSREALGRLGGMDGTVVELNLPLLYPSGERAEPFDLKSLRGRPTLIHFWSSDSPGVAESFEALKKLTDRGMTVVFVNLDGDATKAKAFLSGRLTSGTHVFDPAGSKSGLKDRYGIEQLPQTFQVDGAGALVKHSLQSSQFESVAGSNLPRRRR